MSQPSRSIGRCDECGKSVTVKAFSSDWFYFEADYPCDTCGDPTCGEHHTGRDFERDPDDRNSGGPTRTECPNCTEGVAWAKSRAHDYATSRGV